MLFKIFKKKISEKRLSRATEHSQIVQEKAEAKARAKVLMDRLEARKRALKAD